MTELRVKEAIEYFGTAGKSLGYKHTIEDALPMAYGVVFRSDDIINEDGSVSVTVVPWENVISFTHSVSPAPENANNEEAE